VALEAKDSYVVLAPEEVPARVTGKMRHEAGSREELPAVGDWVAIRRTEDGAAMIHALLPRSSSFTRKAAGVTTEVQVVAANIDSIFVLWSLEHGPNLRGIERYMTVAWQSGALPVVVLTKSDLIEDIAGVLEEVERIAPGASVHAISAINGDGVDELRVHIEGNRTVAMLGSSGAGKSTLINALIGEELMKVQDVRHDGKGRHTTSHRQLIPLDEGGALIDTPGMRELQLWNSEEGIESEFQDIASLAEACRFDDCAHESEPGCAVKEAIETGELSPERFGSYRKQLRELAALARKQDKRLAHEEARKWKSLNKAMREKERMQW
jgi:ribosome biogenesis GTPase